MQTFYRYFLFIFLIQTLCFPLTHAIDNPFYLSVELTGASNEEKYLLIEEELKKLSVEATLKSLYYEPEGWAYSSYGDFFGRTSVGIEARLLAEQPLKDGKRTKIVFKKIGNGGDRCVVTYATFNHAYTKSAKRTAKALEKTGFHGYFLAFLGGYPNPTGEELQFAAVPYAFKIFMMKEAEKLGFNHVLWIDGRCIPLRNLAPLFEQIEHKGSFFMGGIDASIDRPLMLAHTQQVIQEMLGIDPLRSRKIGGGFIGLKMQAPLNQRLIDAYYRLVRKGTPFLSCYPEEFVISAILEYLGREKFVFSNDLPLFHKLLHSDKEIAERQGYFTHHAPKNGNYSSQ